MPNLLEPKMRERLDRSPLRVAAGPGSTAKKVRALVRSHLEPLIDRHDFVQIFLRGRHDLPDESSWRVGRLSRRYERLVHDVIEAGVRSGEFRPDLDCRLATLALLGMCNAVPAWYGKEPDASVHRVAEAFAAVLIEGFAERGKASPRRRPRPD